MPVDDVRDIFAGNAANSKNLEAALKLQTEVTWAQIV